jgi:TupA-like ATPgrasp
VPPVVVVRHSLEQVPFALLRSDALCKSATAVWLVNIRKQRDRFLLLIKTLIKRFLPPKILFLFQKHDIRQTYLRAYLIVNRIKTSPHSPFKKAPRIGYLRGIDFYKGSLLISTLAFAMHDYRRHHGVFPKLLKPTYFDEKLFKSKFFTEIKVPESGNKLLTSRFIPKDLKNSISVAKIIWHSPTAKLPRNNEIMPGYYFLKASHGAGMFKKIRYPLREDELICLEKTCEKWLENKFGLTTGEWWYNTFQKEILIEEPVGTENNPISWHVYTFDGVIGQIMAHRKSESDGKGEFSLFDGDFEILAYPKVPRPVKDICLSQDTKNRLRRYASLIGSQFRFVRVDFLVDDNQKIYLGELTFCPINARLNLYLDDALQAYLGGLWSQEFS